MLHVMTNTCLYGMFYRFHTVCLSSAGRKEMFCLMNECLMTPQHENRSAIGCQNKVDA